MTFSRQVDVYAPVCPGGVAGGQRQLHHPRHVEFYNAIYSAGNPVPSALYWEVATGVADYDLFQPPAFFCRPAGLRPAEGDHTGPALHRTS